MIVDKGIMYGDLKRFRVLLNGNDITAAVDGTQIFQDMFAPTTTCVINLMDTTNMLMTLPIRAGAEIFIEYETDLNCIGDGVQTWNFILYKVADKQVTNSKSQTYNLYAASKEFLINQTKRVMRSYPNKITTDIASSVVKEYLGAELLVHTADSQLNVVVPGWTPFFTLNWLLKTSIKDNAADYVFFQRYDAKFCFKSFEVLYSSSSEYSGITFEINPTHLKDENGDVLFDYATRINHYHFDHFDALSNLSSGFYKNKVMTYDFVRKEWEVKSFTFGDDNAEDKAKLKVDSDYFMGSDEVNISFVPKSTKLFDKGASYLDNSNDWLTSRKSSLMKFEQEKLLIQFPGTAKAAQWFGQSCDVDLPAQDSMTDEVYDKQRRGRYLITAMGHIIGKDVYTINAELVKKRLEE